MTHFADVPSYSNLILVFHVIIICFSSFWSNGFLYMESYKQKYETSLHKQNMTRVGFKDSATCLSLIFMVRSLRTEIMLLSDHLFVRKFIQSISNFESLFVWFSRTPPPPSLPSRSHPIFNHLHQQASAQNSQHSVGGGHHLYNQLQQQHLQQPQQHDPNFPHWMAVAHHALYNNSGSGASGGGR